ncbi:MAG: hypothetical protein WBE79_10045 [Candidatus Cybelea sp.]
MLVQQAVAPVERRAKGLQAWREIATTAHQQTKSLVQPITQLPRAEHRYPRRGQFDGQRNAVEAPANLPNRRCIFVIQ